MDTADHRDAIEQLTAERDLARIERDEARRALADLSVVVELTARGLDAARMQATEDRPVEQLLNDIHKLPQRSPLRIVGPMADTHNRTAAPGATGTAASPTTSKGSRAMEERTRTRAPMGLRAGDVITAHPGHPDRHGEWTVTERHYCGDLVAVDYTCPDGAIGRFVLDPVCRVTVRTTARELQHRAAQVVTELMARRLPQAYWSLTQAGTAVAVVGTADQVTEWAEILGAQVTEEEDAAGQLTAAAAGTYRDVQIKVIATQPAEEGTR